MKDGKPSSSCFLLSLLPFIISPTLKLHPTFITIFIANIPFNHLPRPFPPSLFLHIRGVSGSTSTWGSDMIECDIVTSLSVLPGCGDFGCSMLLIPSLMDEGVPLEEATTEQKEWRCKVTAASTPSSQRIESSTRQLFSPPLAKRLRCSSGSTLANASGGLYGRKALHKGKFVLFN